MEVARLSTSHTLNSSFGSTVALKKNLAVVVASEETEPSFTTSGSTYLFEKADMTSWSDALPTAELTHDANRASTWPLGNAVAIDELRSTIFITNYFYESENNIYGQIRVYKKPLSGWADKIQDFVYQYTAPYNQTMSFDEPYLYFTAVNAISVAAPASSGEWESLEPVASLSCTGCHSQMNFGRELIARDGRVMVGAPGGVTIDREHLILPADPAVYEFSVPAAGWTTGTHFENSKFVYMPTTATDFLFGDQIDIDGDIAIVGAPRDNYAGKGAGAVYVYQLIDLHWERIAVLSPSDGEPDDFFGGSLAISKNFIVVGSVNKHYRDDAGKIVDHNLGAVYIFERPASGWTNMQETHKLVRSENKPDFTDADREDDNFGVTVDIDYPTLVVARYDRFSRPNTGEVYVYNLSAGNPALEAKLTPATDDFYDFGHALKIKGNLIAIGGGPLRFWFGEKNVLLLYQKNGAGWVSGTESAILSPSDVTYGVGFGYSIDMTDDGSKIVVGAPAWFKEGGMEYTGDYFKGAAYVYEKPEGGWTGSIKEKARLTVADQQNYACMGLSVYIEDRYIAVGSPQNYITTNSGESAGSGRVYFYQMPDAGWSAKQPDKIIEGDEAGNPVSDYFGSSVVGVYGYLMVGAIADDNQNSVDAGSVYVYTEYPFVFPGQSPVCDNEPPIQLAAFPSGGTWTGNGFQNPSTGIFDPAFAGKGIHRVRYKVDDCDASNTLLIDVREVLAPFNLSSADSLFFCGSPEKKLTAPVREHSEHTWDYSTDGINFTAITNALLHELTVNNEGFYRANLSNQCSTIADTVWVGNLYPDAGEDFAVCMSDQVRTLIGNYSAGTWSGPGLTDITSFSPSIAGRGEHELIFSVLATPGCIYRDTLTATVKGISTLEISATGEEAFCYTGQTTLTATDLSNVTYQWHFAQNENDFTELSDNDHAYSATTLGYYKVTAFDGLCSRETVYHLIPSTLEVDIQPIFDSISFCHNAPVQVEAQSIPEATYNWISLTSAHDAETVKTSYDNFNTEIGASGSYQLLVENHGCSFLSHVMTAKRIPADTIFVPNIITPNGDGYNDHFTIYKEGFDKYSLFIINRYGSVVFVANENSERWPGEGSSGIYFWALNYFAACENRERQIKGILHVVR